MDEPRWIPARKAAQMLNVHRYTIYRWAERAENGSPYRLQRVRRDVNQRLFVDAEEVLDMIKSTFRQ